MVFKQIFSSKIFFLMIFLLIIQLKDILKNKIKYNQEIWLYGS